MATKIYDAIVIGAGPAGGAASRRLTNGGMKTLLIEKKKMPRRKMCSGLLSRWTVDFVNRNFGPIPTAAYTEIPFLQGFAFNFPSVPKAVELPSKDLIPYVRRDQFDYFLAKNSGAEIQDGVRMEGIERENDVFKITCRRISKKGKSTRLLLRARYVVAADSANSRAVRCMVPGAQHGMPLTTAIQKFYRGKIDLNPNYFHLFFHQGIGFFPWANMKGERVVIGLTGIGHRKPIRYFDAYESLLQERYGLEIKEVLQEEAMAGYMMGPLNHFVLGQGNFLAAGDAAGFIHGAEGISAALVSGDAAAQAILKAERTDQKAIGFYRKLVRNEVNRCLDQTNYLRMSKNGPMLIEGKSFFAKHSLNTISLIAKDLKGFAAQDNGFKEMGLGKIAKKNTLHYLFHRSYPVEL